MINEETRRKLREINLGEAIKGLEVQQADWSCQYLCSL